MLISNAYAQTAAAAGPLDGIMQFLPIIVMFGVLYFLMIRPQMKKAKEHKAMVEALAKGDEVVTQGGLAGRISKLNDNGYVTLDISSKEGAVEVLVQQSAVTLVLPKDEREVISFTPAIVPSTRSRGVATVAAMVSGLAPGSEALTEMVGISTCGNGAIGSCVRPIRPASVRPSVISVVATGLAMKGAEMFMSLPVPPRAPAATR